MSPPLPPPAPTPAAFRAQGPLCYDAARYGAAVDWTPRAITVDGVARAIVSAEFHYFRVPDRARWRPLLAAIRGAGFNAVRFYVHWGYHSPAEGVLKFDGNRDLGYLFDLCEELHLFAIPAPGPYICAEVQGGGFPLWLIAKRELRIRHLINPPLGLKKVWDERFFEYCAEYWRAVMAIMLPHERTTNPGGCVIALQIENELRSEIFGLLGGLDDEVVRLAQISREMGSTVPFFHNDDSPIGSWATGEPKREPKSLFRKTGPAEFRTDLYGFDLYFTFPPGDKSGDKSSCQLGMLEGCGVSACLNLCGVGGSGVGGSDTKGLSCCYDPTIRSAPPPALDWVAAGQMPAAVDGLEDRMNSIGGSAASAPPFVAETQVGWINQWARLRGYDQIYDFFGNHFSSTLLLSLQAQGISMTNHYMAYGGTNHGALGDTEVYTSYDYSAFIREFGMLSTRGRRMRQASFFLRTFAARGLANSDNVAYGGVSGMEGRRKAKKSKNATTNRVKTTVPKALVTVRAGVLPSDSEYVGVSRPIVTQPPLFAFLRHLYSGSGHFNLIVDGVVVPAYLPSCDSMVAPLFYPLGPADKLEAVVFACTVPVIARGEYAGSELWVLRTREAERGRLVLQVPRPDDNVGVVVQYATLPWGSSNQEIDDRDPRNSGVLRATHKDAGAATSILNAPLEELGLNEWAPFENENSAPVAIRASTEEVGQCFSVAFAGRRDACVLALNDVTTLGTGNEKPFLRIVCLSPEDADTFSADCSADDPFLKPTVSKSERPGEVGDCLAIAWGADELGFLPNNSLHVAFSAVRKSRVYLLHPGSSPRAAREVVGSAAEDFMAVTRESVKSIMPFLAEYVVPHESVSNALTVVSSNHSSDSGQMPALGPLDKSYELVLDGWEKRALNWSSDVEWKDITPKQFDPLDHMICGGHIAYRMRFKTTAKSASMVLNVRHVAAVWCNGVSVGSQIVYSHNFMSAGAMHAVDLSHAGKQRHNLTRGLEAISPEADGVHEVIILVLSFGQSRSPFLLNDVRNKRGLLSARLTRTAKVTEAQWSIAGVDVSKLDNASETSGLPLESEVNDKSYSSGFVSHAGMPAIVPSDGVVFFRTSFRVPSCSILGGNVRYPLRVRIDAANRSVAVLWVNGVQIGRYVEAAGPQSDFYIPEGTITEPKHNSLVVAAYGPSAGACSVRVLPWVVDPVSGNLNPEHGQVFALREVMLSLKYHKP